MEGKNTMGLEIAKQFGCSSRTLSFTRPTDVLLPSMIVVYSKLKR